MIKTSKQKTFVIINSYYLGDILLVNPLIQNIKRIWPNSKIVMLTPETFVDVAKYQKGVDDVIVWDRADKHKGVINTFKFVLNFPYKNIFACFPIYSTYRPIILSKLLGAKYILAVKKNREIDLLISNKKREIGSEESVQEVSIKLLERITNEKLINVPMVYDIPNIPSKFDNLKQQFGEYIVLSPISSRREKDMPIETLKEIISNTKTKVVLLGHGNLIKNLSEELSKEKFDNLIDFTNKTSIVDLAKIIKSSKGVISVDTGILHFACALDIPVLGVFYVVGKSPFMPNSDIYKSDIIMENLTAENICNKFSELVSKYN